MASFTLIRGPWPGGEKEHIVKVGAGVSFSILLTASGKRELIKFTEELEVLIVLSNPCHFPFLISSS